MTSGRSVIGFDQRQMKNTMIIQSVLKGMVRGFKHLKWAHNGRFFSTCDETDKIKIWDERTQQILTSVKNSSFEINDDDNSFFNEYPISSCLI
jgi:WD40 repeat protein